MNQIFDLSLRSLRWLRRFRHRCGYGIHSPFAFGFVTGVVYERGQYYAYASLSRRHPLRSFAGGLRERDLRLLFRVANASGASSVCLYAADAPEVEAYVRAGLTRAYIYNVSSVDVATESIGETLPPRIDFFYAEADTLSPALLTETIRRAGGKAYFVLHGIERNGAARAAWCRLKADRRVRVTFNLYDFGIACFEARLNKEDYLINYF